MTCEIGSRVGPYQITAEIGAGGMGVVYRAHDSRLGRDVAIKVSAERFSERFEREARAVAALNHSNICTLHDIGPDYLVMELVEGETLADLLAHRPRSSPGVPLDEALRIARQIASALDAAHDAGIVHRDLKPGNIKIKDDGTVKVLDFGLAKIHGAPDAIGGGAELTQSPTILATQAGLILGTAPYMSPEQARGKAVDKRADIWAFGVVVYEMLTGRRPFDGEDVSTTVAAVIQSEPAWDAVPKQVQRLLKKCLAKDPRQRLRDIGDVWELLDDLPAPSPATSGGGTGWVAAGAIAIVAGVALWAPWRAAPPPADRPLVRFNVDLGSDVSLPPLVTPTTSLAISPDGMRVAYIASVAGGPFKLLTRRLDEPAATELSGTEGAVNPFFTQDGRWVVFQDGTKLNKVPVEGGAPQPIPSTTGASGGGQEIDGGDLIVGTAVGKGLLRVRSGGGEPAIVGKLGEGELFFTNPRLLPGRNELLVTVLASVPTVERAMIDVISLEDGRRKTVARGGLSARYLESGHLVYSNRGALFAVVFDLAALETRGTAMRILDDIAYDSVGEGAQFDISRDGTLVYRPGADGGLGPATVAWLDPAGSQTSVPSKPANYVPVPRLSPDGKLLAVAIKEKGSQDIWIHDIERNGDTRLTFANETYTNPIWTPDGRFVVFGSLGNGLFWSRADGSPPQPLLGAKTIAVPFSFSPDGKRLAYFDVVARPQIWTVPIETGDGLKAGTPERYLTTQFTDSFPMFSPDGRWLAYQSDESGRPQIYVRGFSASPSDRVGRSQISNTGGTAPLWSPNRRELLYQDGDQVMAVDYNVTGGTFVAGKPRVWSKTLSGAQGFDLSPDGKRLLVLPPTQSPNTSQPQRTLVFMQNFLDELRRRVPVR